MPKLVNRAKMTTATTGTGTLTLGSAVAGYQTFANAGVANSNIVRYTIEDGDAWEIGLGTYSSTGTTLTRGTIESSTGTAINLSGNATVFVTAAAGDLQELVTFAETFALPTADGTNGQVLTTNGTGTLTFSTISGYTNADVDAHLNTGTATTGEVLTWNGSDYDWIAVSGGATDINGLSDAVSAGDVLALGNGAFNDSTPANTLIRATAVGVDAMRLGAVSTSTAVGAWSLYNATGGGDHVAVGAQSLYSATTSSRCVAIGESAAINLTTGNGNIAVGRFALAGHATSKLTGAENTGIGYQTGYDLSSGSNNFLGGYRAGYDLTTGSDNVAIGNGALDAATTGGQNIAIGLNAMGSGVATSSAGVNVAIGVSSGASLTSGNNNTFVGRTSGQNTSGASENTYLGSRAGINQTGGSNTAVGYNALVGAVGASGVQNVAVGISAGDKITSGIRNTFVGAFAGFDSTTGITTGGNNTLIGHQAQASSATVSNEITLGNSSITTLRCQVTTITSLSDARDKTDIQPLNAGLEFVEALNPVSFTWNMRDGGKVGVADTGFIAQDLQMAQEWAGVTIPGLVYDVNPDKLEAGYGKLIPVLVQAIKDLSAKVNLLEAQLEAQK